MILIRSHDAHIDCPAPKNNSANAASIPNLVADPALHCRHHVLVSGRGFQLIILWSWISLVFGKNVLRKTLECPHCSRLTCFHWRPSQRQTFVVKRLQWFRHHNFLCWLENLFKCNVSLHFVAINRCCFALIPPCWGFSVFYMKYEKIVLKIKLSQKKPCWGGLQQDELGISGVHLSWTLVKIITIIIIYLSKNQSGQSKTKQCSAE